MKAHILDADALRAITPLALTAYARSRNWRWTETYGQHADVYVSPKNEEALIPRTDRLADYAAAVSSVLGAFAKEADTDEFSIYRDLIGADHDVVRVRAIADEDDGSIPIDAGVEIVRQARDLLLAAACSVHNPQPYYRAGANRDAAEYMRNVKLGQTEHGSFVVTLLAPVPPMLSPQQPPLDPSWAGQDDEPWERLVTRRLVSALNASRSATEASVIAQSSSFYDAVEQGVSANLCEALAGLVEQSQETEISVTWAKTRPESEPRSRIVFSRKDGAVLKEAARTFRLRQPRENEALFGKVTHLRRDTMEMDGQVTLKALVEGKLQSVTAVLDSSAYSRVLHAHDRKFPIVVRGDLRRIGQRWSLEQARLVEVVDSGDEP